MTRTRIAAWAGAVVLAAGAAGDVAAQSLADRVNGAPDGRVHMSFAAREGVCGNGDNISIRPSRDGEWEGRCDDGPVRVSLLIARGKVTKIRTYVSGAWRATGERVTDLGTVPARAAAEYLLDLAERGGAGAKDAIFPATIADSFTAWPGLLRVARSERAAAETRKSAIFWLGQAAGERVTPALDSVAGDRSGDREVREAAVFALSQRPRDEGVPALMRLARNDRDPEIRRRAIFWLGQSEDPRAISFFEEVLTAR